MPVNTIPPNTSIVANYTLDNNQFVDLLSEIKSISEDLRILENTDLAKQSKEHFAFYDASLMLFQNPKDGSYHIQLTEMGLKILNKRSELFDKFIKLFKYHNLDLEKVFLDDYSTILKPFQERFTLLVNKFQDTKDSIQPKTILVSLMTLAEYHLWKVEAPNPYRDNLSSYKDREISVNGEDPFFISLRQNCIASSTFSDRAKQFLYHYNALHSFIHDINVHKLNINDFIPIFNAFCWDMYIFAEYALCPPIDMSEYSKPFDESDVQKICKKRDKPETSFELPTLTNRAKRRNI